ncbi:MAG TPA: pilus assembly protein N-terminal domain-containing protein [Candidatus Limnocylindria bacterium]|nr:pilus assembly protein N-terminal domain-containing protein [Candidatus Limnocylindria bacterium]
MRPQLARVAGYALLGLAAAVVPSGPVAAQSLSRLYVGVDRSHVLEVGDPARKVAVANPNIADVQVISPTQLLVVGKAPGVTSLVIFSGKAPRQFDLVVHPSPLGTVTAPSGTEAPHAVLVQRGASMTEQLFTRDKDQRWQELGQVKPDTAEPGKK